MKKTKRILSLVLAVVACLSVLTITSSASSTLLRRGSRGEDVRTLQTMLNRVDNAGLVEDGIFGSATYSAVTRFQKANNLAVDGIVGPLTKSALEKKYNALTKPQSNFANTPSNVRTYSLSRDGETRLFPNFKVKEFRSKDGSNTVLIDDKLVAALQDIRNHFGSAVHITSGYRSPSYNAVVGGSKNSYHTKGMAVDIKVTGVSPIEVARYAEKLGLKGIGLYNTFVHLDTRTTKYFWKTDAVIPVSTFN